MAFSANTCQWSALQEARLLASESPYPYSYTRIISPCPRCYEGPICQRIGRTRKLPKSDETGGMRAVRDDIAQAEMRAVRSAPSYAGMDPPPDLTGARRLPAIPGTTQTSPGHAGCVRSQEPLAD